MKLMLQNRFVLHFCFRGRRQIDFVHRLRTCSARGGRGLAFESAMKNRIRTKPELVFNKTSIV